MRIQANSSLLFQLLQPTQAPSPAQKLDPAGVSFDRSPNTLVSNLGNFLAAQAQSTDPETVDANGNPLTQWNPNEVPNSQVPQYYGNQVLFSQNVVAPDNPNACGTTSLAMVLADFGIIEPTYAAAQDVDHDVRPWGGFTAPGDLQAYAQSKGLNSEGYNNSAIADLQKASADPANRVMVMVNGPHWEVCLGVNDDPTTGQPVSVSIADPATGMQKIEPIEKFMSDWKDPMASSNDGAEVAGYTNYMQVFSDQPLAPGGDADIATTQVLTHDLTNIANAAHLLPGDWNNGNVGGVIDDVAKMFGNGVQGIIELPSAIGQLAGNAIAVATGASAPVATAVATATAAAIPGGADGAVAAAVTQATGSDVVGDIVGAVVDPVGAVINAIGDFFGSL